MLLEFFFSLDRNLEDVDSFYNKKYADAARRLKLLEDRYGKPTKLPTSMDRDEVEDLMGALLELRGQLRKLQWYGEVNRRGFIKITKKLDKKVAKDSTQRRYLESKVDPKEFATNINLSDSMKIVNDWLSKLGDVKLFDDKSSTHSSHSLHRVSSKVILDLPVGTLDKVDHAIRNDDASSLMIYLEELNLSAGGDKDIALLLLNLLQRAITCKAKNCVDKLLDQVESLDEGDDLNKRNCIHRFVITMGRPKRSSDGDTAADETHLDDTTNYITPAAPPILAPPSSYAKELDGSKRFGRDDKSVVLLEHVLDKLRLEQRDALCTRDVYGRMPLHYAAQHGLAVVCQVITERMQAWGQFDVSAGLDAPYWQDLDGYAPLHLSVIGGHPLTVKAILEAEDWRGVSDRKAAVSQNISKSGEVLALATKANFVVIVRLLVEAGVDLDYQDDQGETALHVAARFGHTECASALLDGSGSQRANTEIGENAFGWTPLFIASVDGHLGIVELLIAAEADLDKMDTSGWTAKEHAALRGHMNIARLLAATTIAPYGSDSEASTVNSPSPPSSVFNSCSPPSSNGSIADRKSNLATSSNAAVRTTEPVKTFGHRYLTKETMVLVSLGTMDTRKAIEAVNLDRIPFTSAHSTLLDTALSVVVSATNANGEPSITDLPVQDNVSTEPIVFTTNDATKVKLLFDIVPTYAGTNEQVVGRAVALLSSIKPSIGSKRISLQGDVTVPIIAANTLEVIGSVNFNFLVITPFTHPNMTITENQTYWKSMTSTMVIGHRGDSPPEYFPLGLYLTDAKVWAKMLPPEALFSLVKTLFRYLNVRCERWYDASDPSQSFIAAANLGASYVEV